MKDGLDRTGKKNRYKAAKIASTGMCHRMHFLDLQQLDCWPNDCNEVFQREKFYELFFQVVLCG